MDRHVAEALMNDLKAVFAGMNQLSDTTMSIADQGERRAYRKALGECMAEVLSKLEQPILGQFPDLKP